MDVAPSVRLSTPVSTASSPTSARTVLLLTLSATEAPTPTLSPVATFSWGTAVVSAVVAESAEIFRLLPLRLAVAPLAMKAPASVVTTLMANAPATPTSAPLPSPEAPDLASTWAVLPGIAAVTLIAFASRLAEPPMEALLSAFTSPIATPTPTPVPESPLVAVASATVETVCLALDSIFTSPDEQVTLPPLTRALVSPVNVVTATAAARLTSPSAVSASFPANACCPCVVVPLSPSSVAPPLVAMASVVTVRSLVAVSETSPTAVIDAASWTSTWVSPSTTLVASVPPPKSPPS